MSEAFPDSHFFSKLLEASPNLVKEAPPSTPPSSDPVPLTDSSKTKSIQKESSDKKSKAKPASRKTAAALINTLKELEALKSLPLALIHIIVDYNRKAGFVFLGGSTKDYTWDQNRKEITIKISMPKTVEARKDLIAVIKRDHLYLAYRHRQDRPIIEGDLYGPVYTFEERADSNYLLEQESGKGVKTLTITLQKVLTQTYKPRKTDLIIDLVPFPQYRDGMRCLEDYWPKLFKEGPSWNPYHIPPWCQDFKEIFRTTDQANLYVDEAFFLGHNSEGHDVWRAEVTDRSPLTTLSLSSSALTKRFITLSRHPYTGKVMTQDKQMMSPVPNPSSGSFPAYGF